MFIVLKLAEIGRIKAISTSKIKNKIEIVKNRREKDKDFTERGSNPHSKGDIFSRSLVFFLAMIKARTPKIVETKKKQKLRVHKAKILFYSF